MPTLMGHVAVDVAPVVVEPGPPTGVDATLWAGPVEDETVLATIRFARPIGEGGQEVLVQPTFAFAQQVRVNNPVTGDEDWHVLGELMNAVGSTVTQVVGHLYNANRLDNGPALGQMSGPRRLMTDVKPTRFLRP